MKINKNQIKLLKNHIKTNDPIRFSETFENIANVTMYKGEDHLRKQVKRNLFIGRR